jgi:hypothetical protein
MKNSRINSLVFGFAFCFLASPGLTYAFEISAQNHSCGGDSGIQYVEKDIAGQIALQAFQACSGQAVRQVSAIRFDAKRVADNNCEAFDELVTGTGEFECVPGN